MKSMYLIKSLRRKNNIIEHNIVGTDIWVEVDSISDVDIIDALEKKDFAKYKGINSWVIGNDGYDYCRINLRD